MRRLSQSPRGAPIRAFLWLCLLQLCAAFTYSPIFSVEQTSSHRRLSNRHVIALHASQNDEFWQRQKDLVAELSESTETSLRQEQLDKFAARRNSLLADTAYFTSLIFCACWGLFDNPFVAVSFLFGSTFGLLYAYGLSKYVETLGASFDDTEAVQGSGVGQARFAFLILLFILVGRLREYGLIEIPSIMGFFTYQLASLNQGLREIND